MNNDIMKFLNIEDKNIIISKILIDANTKEIYLEMTLKVEYCPACSSRMHSKGKYIRKINHPILQDGYQLKLIVTIKHILKVDIIILAKKELSLEYL